MTTLNTLLKRIDRFTQHVNHLIDTYVDQTLVTTDIIKAQQTLAILSNLHKERLAKIANVNDTVRQQSKDIEEKVKRLSHILEDLLT